MQPQVTFIGTDDLDKTITVAVHNRRVEFFVKPAFYLSAIRDVRRAISQEWYNQAISKLLTASNQIHFEGETYEPRAVKITVHELRFKRGQNMSNKIPKPANATHSPDNEHKFTLIAPEAQNGLVYQGQRIWHPTQGDAIDYAKVIYNANKEQQFTLAVVQIVEEVAPKPQIELTSKKYE